nr:sce7726 family protein [Novosphingobium sp. FKTRR1]
MPAIPKNRVKPPELPTETDQRRGAKTETHKDHPSSDQSASNYQVFAGVQLQQSTLSFVLHNQPNTERRAFVEIPDSLSEQFPVGFMMASAAINRRGDRETVAPSSTQLAAITRLFSSAVFREMARKGRSPLFARLIGLAEIGGQCPDDATVGQAFEAAFGVLKTAGRRDEYVYRSALTHNVLMGTHSLNTACMLTEFRAGACKADLAILNGTATVYEIKSERDSLARLANQVENYKRVFAKAYVIAGEGHVASVLATVPEDVGVMMLSSRYRISTVREAEDRPDRICPVTVFESLRSDEAGSILKRLGVPLPDVPNTLRHGVMRDLFQALDPTEVHIAMVKTLKRTRDLSPLSSLVEKLPRSLHAAALSIQVRRSEHERIVEAVSTPLGAALAWV